MHLILVVYVVVVFVAIVFMRELLNRRAAGDYAYRRNPNFLSKAEVDFYRALVGAVAEQYLVFAKVRLRDLIVPAGRDRYQIHFNKVVQKHVDFVLCDPERHLVVAVVELDDSSHGTEKARVRDSFVDKALGSAGIPTVRFRWRPEHDSGYIREAIAREVAAQRAG
jgi:very-short-patch-repair endonuclease